MTAVCGLKTLSVCTFKTSPCVPAPRPHAEKHVRVLPAYTGTFLNLHTEAFRVYTRGFQRDTAHTTPHDITPHTHTTTHTHHQHTETETEKEDRERRQRKKTEREKRREKREERRKEKRRKEKRREDEDEKEDEKQENHDVDWRGKRCTQEKAKLA